MEDPVVDSVLVVFAPTVRSTHTDEIARVLAAVAARSRKPVVTTFLGTGGVPSALRRLDEGGIPRRGSVPSYPSPEEAARALGHVTAYAAWRDAPTGRVPEVDGCDPAGARRVVREVLATEPEGAELAGLPLRSLLACYGIELLEMVPAPDVESAVAAGERLGWNVVLKATAPHLRHRPDLADVWRNIDTEDEMRDAWATMLVTLADPAEAHFVVQAMAPTGVPVVVRAREDDLFGPIVSFGVAGITTELLGDRAYRIPPLTDRDAEAMVGEIKSAPLLRGYRGGDVADLAAVRDLLHRVSRLTDDLPEVSLLDLDPVLVAREGLSVVNATARVAPPALRSDWYTRRLG
jgi:acyl-CoA synthetase (NDP forming)